MREKAGMLVCVVLVSFLSLTGCEKHRLDQQVRELCAKDGGIKVYETVTLPKERFDQWGNVKIPSKDRVTVNDEYFYERDVIYYKEGNPSFSRSRHQIIRRRDGKVLGESIRYTRGGGDLPGPWHDSTFICPSLDSKPTLEASIFRGE